MRRDGPIRTLVLQSSPLFYTLVAGAVRRHADISLLPPATSAVEARERILAHHPEAIVFDLGLMRRNGKELLQDLREHYPVPIVGCGGSSRTDGAAALSAIESGVLDVVSKPPGSGAAAVRALGEELGRRIRTAVTEARPVPLPRLAGEAGPDRSFREAGLNPGDYLIVVGASTGGTEAVRMLLARMPADAPGIAIVQHMPAFFTPSFAARLDAYSPLRVTEASDRDVLGTGRAVVARGDTHLTIRRSGAGWQARYTNRQPVNRHCPSVDVLFGSAVEAAGSSAVGVLMTGMGEDGARGLLELRRAGALTVAQDARSCVVHGMPKVARALDAVECSGPPGGIPRLIMQALVQRRARRAGAAQGG